MKVMKYKLLSVSKNVPAVNIGDYIQALASSQFYPHVDGFVERDELSLYDGDECGVIMNGWYMANPDNWPPSEKIKPLFVAFHINSKAKTAMKSPQSIAYLKRYEPIGCRDYYTRDMLLQNGVQAYFSGCMTLTLGKNYRCEKKNDKVYFVDPYFETHWNVNTVIRGLMYLLKNLRSVSKIAKRYPERKSFMRKCFILTAFHREYKKYFPVEVLENAEYICQQSHYYNEKFSTDAELLSEAERLVKNYAKARLVVTSRIHCALPCLGVETPVIFTEDKNQSEASSCRLGGLREFFNIMTWNVDSLQGVNDTEKMINIETLPPNKDSWRSCADNLIGTCNKWIRQYYGKEK